MAFAFQFNFEFSEGVCVIRNYSETVMLLLGYFFKYSFKNPSQITIGDYKSPELFYSFSFISSIHLLPLVSVLTAQIPRNLPAPFTVFALSLMPTSWVFPPIDEADFE